MRCMLRGGDEDGGIRTEKHRGQKVESFFGDMADLRRNAVTISQRECCINVFTLTCILFHPTSAPPSLSTDTSRPYFYP